MNPFLDYFAIKILLLVLDITSMQQYKNGEQTMSFFFSIQQHYVSLLSTITGTIIWLYVQFSSYCLSLNPSSSHDVTMPQLLAAATFTSPLLPDHMMWMCMSVSAVGMITIKCIPRLHTDNFYLDQGPL